MKRFPILMFLLLTAAARADVIPFDPYSQNIYLFRISTDAGVLSVAPDQGVFVFDPKTGLFDRVMPFVYRDDLHPFGRVNLAALEDRLVIQGSDYFEIDLLSGRFLRRYRGNVPGGWVLQGPIVPKSLAAILGIEPGVYGFLICPESAASSGHSCEPTDVPGFRSILAGERLFNYVFHRPLDPGARTIRLVKEYDPDAQNPFGNRRHLVLDGPARRFLSVVEKRPDPLIVPIVKDINAIEIRNGSLGPEMLLLRRTDTDRERYRKTEEFAYLPSIQSVFEVVYEDGKSWEYRLVQRPLAGGEEQVINRVSSSTPQPRWMDGPLTALPGTLPERYEQLIPAVGEAPGANGTDWRSDVYLFNPSESAVTVSLRRVSKPEISRTIEIEPRASVILPRVLRAFGGGPLSRGGDGIHTDALVADSPYRWGEQLVISSRTYTPAPGGGSYGQAVPSVPSTIGYTNHHPEYGRGIDSFAAGDSLIILDKRDPDRYRHNIGVVNDTDMPLTVRLRLAVVTPNPPSDPRVEQSFLVPPHSVSNVNLESLYPPEILAERPPRLWLVADQPAAIWVSMIDNITGDATFIPFTLFGLRGTRAVRSFVPGVGSTPGANNSLWRTDLYGYFPVVELNETPQQPDSLLRMTGCTSSAKLQGVGGNALATSPFWHSIFPDVARQFSCTGESLLGALGLRVASWTAGFARTYTTRPDGGTYGDMLPFYPHDGWPVQHFAGVVVNEKFRANLGMYNGQERTTTYTLRLFDEGGRLAHETTIALAAHESRQNNLATWFGASLEPGLYGLTVIPHDENGDQGRSWAYVSIVDNMTNDPTNWW